MTQMSHTMSTAGQLMSRRLTIRLATLATSFMTTKSQHRQRLLRLRIRLCHCHHLWLCATHSATIHLDCDCHSYPVCRVPCTGRQSGANVRNHDDPALDHACGPNRWWQICRHKCSGQSAMPHGSAHQVRCA